MLGKFKSNSSSAANSNKSGHRLSTVVQLTPKSAQEKSSVKLKRRKGEKVIAHQDPPSKPPKTSTSTSSEPSGKKPGAAFFALPVVPRQQDNKLKDPSTSFSVFETEFRPYVLPKRETTLADEEVVTPDRRTLPAYDLRRDNSPAKVVLNGKVQEIESSEDKKVGPLASCSSNGSNSDSESRRINRSSSDFQNCMPRKLVRKSASDTSSGISTLSAIRRRFTYTSGVTVPSPIEEELSEVDLKQLSIQATRSPEFSTASDSSKPVPVTIVDSLSHQKSSSLAQYRLSHRVSSVPSTIAESEFNEDLLLEQQEVLSYLYNSLIAPPSPAFSAGYSLSSDGGLPHTPPPPTAIKDSLGRENSIARSTRGFVGSMVAEFPYLLGEDNSDIPETGPLQPKISTDLYGLGLHAETTTSLPLPQRPTEFPPSPPQSDHRASLDDTSQAILDELASESTSMRSVVDAINRAASPRSSLDYTDSYYNYSYDNQSIYGEHMPYPPLEVEKPWTSTSAGVELDDTESIYEFSAPVLRTGRASQIIEEDLPNPQSLSRTDSVASSAQTEFEDANMPIAQVLAERRRVRPSLPPLVITPIAPGQYGPPLQRRQHFRGRSQIGSPQSAKVRDNKPKGTPVKVVEEEVVEYTPIEEGHEMKGWMKQRRVSRGGDWVVVEREILSHSAI